MRADIAGIALRQKRMKVEGWAREPKRANSTEVPLRLLGSVIESCAMGPKMVCAEHERLRIDAVAVILEAKKIRRDKDVSFYQDVELSRDAHQKTDALLLHLLAGHDGKPCPSGDRPIVGAAQTAPISCPRRQHLLRTQHDRDTKCS
jgi:hypothetical protein